MTAAFRFYAELNDFLPEPRRMRTFAYAFDVSPSVKDAIEAQGVPHTEVDLILANGESVDFSYLLRDGDRISVYPMFESLDIRPLLRVRPEPLRETRFVLDIHLGRLAAYLRMFGFDTLYRNDFQDEDLARISRDEHRILLTRDRGLLKRGMVTHGYLVRETGIRAQVSEVLRRFDLFDSIAPFSRCLRCNAPLEPVAASSIEGRVPEKVAAVYSEFYQCPVCRRPYWKGSHYHRMQAFIGELRGPRQRPAG